MLFSQQASDKGRLHGNTFLSGHSVPGGNCLNRRRPRNNHHHHRAGQTSQESAYHDPRYGSANDTSKGWQLTPGDPASSAAVPDAKLLRWPGYAQKDIGAAQIYDCYT
jgi:hypothetical protein